MQNKRFKEHPHFKEHPFNWEVPFTEETCTESMVLRLDPVEAIPDPRAEIEDPVAVEGPWGTAHLQPLSYWPVQPAPHKTRTETVQFDRRGKFQSYMRGRERCTYPEAKATLIKARQKAFREQARALTKSVREEGPADRPAALPWRERNRRDSGI